VTQLELFPEDWSRALAVVAHPDDMEYGAAAAVARWTAQGKWVGYVLVSAGEAGIEGMAPTEAGPARQREQVDSCSAVGVDAVEFLDHRDGYIQEGLALRADLTRVLRKHRPDVVLSINFRESWGGPSWNHADHRAVGRSLLDAVRDTANEWMFPDLGAAWRGIRFAAFGGSPQPTHAVDITDHFDAGVRSLQCHRVYLEHLDGDMASPEGFLRARAEEAGSLLGVGLATTFEVIA
jgi:LmbE family N-acetylglucosaminyl deacetylase